ncbi:MAG: hypothetical protein ATN33_05900 [Epulopiscium sp. Nele67-Bin001]|nr:MAG: hypothetical protein ATN33_05900 [Epulopiscium sp. Nele67-Bin001]
MVTNLLICIFILAFTAHNYLLLKFMSTMFSAKSGAPFMLLIAFINSVVNFSVRTVFPMSVPMSYFIICLLYFWPTYVLFDAQRLTKITFGLMTPVHLVADSFIINSIFVLISGYTYSEIFSMPDLFLVARIVTSLSLSGFIIILCKVFGTKYFSLLRNHPERMKIFVSLELVLLILLLVISTIFMSTEFNVYIVLTILVAAVACVVIFYIGVFMVVGFEMLDDYRIYSHSKLLENMYRNMLIEKSERTIEIDCKTGKIINYVVKDSSNKPFVGAFYEDALHDIIDSRIHPDDQDSYIAKHKLSYMLIMCSAGNVATYDCEYRLLNEDMGEYYWYKDFISVQKSPTNNAIKAVLVTNDIQLHKNLEFSANMDGLTGLYNKTVTEELISEYLETNRDGVLFMIDVDNFKAINDNFGHDVGDEVIRDVATKLSCIFKKGDILGRMGGDEFMVFVKSPGPLNIEDKATQLCDTIYTTYYNDLVKVSISASIGICEVHDKVCSFNDLYKIGDMAMYESKSRGKNTYTIRQI